VCSILCVFNIRQNDDIAYLRGVVLERSQAQRHRGPDWSGIHVDSKAILSHERLSIIDPEGGSQPLISADGELALAVNGEIYNHMDLKRRAKQPYAYQTQSDGEVINALYLESQPNEFLNQINGIYAFALWDKSKHRHLIARDPIGVCPLYWGHDAEGRMWISSEMKGLAGLCADVAQFPPGHYYDSAIGEIRKFYSRPWREYSATEGVIVAEQELRDAFESAVSRQMMSDVPCGVLLSGGLDSSLVTACATRFSRRGGNHQERETSWWAHVHSFAIGLQGAPDLAAAELAARYLRTVHHGFVYTAQQGIDALPDVIRHVETYDVTTIRSAIPTYLLARRIKAMGVKMVLSGEGADEVFGGYLYFHKAPSAREFHEETVRKLDALHLYDCARANKATMAWGVEMRVPFLDVEFLDVAMSMDASAKMAGDGRMEKGVLRRAFAGYLPDSILWRQKEQFSDGVGYAWIDSLRAFADQQVTDRDLAAAPLHFPVNTPRTKEAYLYRRIFQRYYTDAACALSVPWGKSIACSSPAALAWDASFSLNPDPSGRALLNINKSSPTTSAA
jgi:asparagine synthase (glutamine-hydrolysing)